MVGSSHTVMPRNASDSLTAYSELSFVVRLLVLTII